MVVIDILTLEVEMYIQMINIQQLNVIIVEIVVLIYLNIPVIKEKHGI